MEQTKRDRPGDPVAHRATNDVCPAAAIEYGCDDFQLAGVSKPLRREVDDGLQVLPLFVPELIGQELNNDLAQARAGIGPRDLTTLIRRRVKVGIKELDRGIYAFGGEDS